MNKLERLIIKAPFWLRVLIVIWGVAALGLIVGHPDALVDFAVGYDK